MKTEDYIEKLISQGKIDPIELEKKIEEEREKSPILLENALLKNRVQAAEDAVVNASTTQQELLELLVELGVI